LIFFKTRNLGQLDKIKKAAEIQTSSILHLTTVGQAEVSVGCMEKGADRGRRAIAVDAGVLQKVGLGEEGVY